MSDLEALLGVVGRRRRRDGSRVTWFGQTACDLADPGAARHLASITYSFAYCLGRPVPLEERPQPRVDAGWFDVRPDSRLCAVWTGWHMDPAGRLSAPGQPVVTAPAPRLTASQPLTLELAAVSTEAIPGWLLLRHGDVTSNQLSLRVYANTCAGLVRPLVGQLVTVLLEHGLDGFAVKLLATSDHNFRADSTVLYLPGDASRAVVSDVSSAIHGAVTDPAIPMFTCPYGPGIALARSPAGGRSFGETRCMQVADSLITALRAGSRDPEDLPFDRRAPWDDGVSAPIERFVTSRVKPLVTRSLPNPWTALVDLADVLAAEAIVADGRATWLVHDTGSDQLVSAGAEVYAGSAGPLAVLSHAFRVNQDARHLRLAKATARAMLARQPGLSPHGFHSGRAGVAAVLAEAAVITRDEEMRSLALRSVRHARSRAPASREWDVLSGTAGSILGLHAAATLLGLDLSNEVRALCSQLERQAELDSVTGRVRWRSQIGRRRPALAGLAHGASGAALALAVGDRPGEPVPELVARSVRFEDEARSTSAGWMDHRQPGANAPAVAWCHGAGGIGVVSAAAARRYGDGAIARAAVARRRLSAALRTSSSDAGLCHGAAGRALALAVVDRALEHPDPAGEALTAFDRLPMRGDASGVKLMNGEPGVVLAALAVGGAIPPPIAFVLDPCLWETADFGLYPVRQCRTR